MSSTLENVEQNFVALASSSTGVHGDTITEDRENAAYHIQGNKSFHRPTTAGSDNIGTCLQYII